MMVLVMKNFELKFFGDLLYGLILKGKDSRMRSRFVTLIEGQLELINKERDSLMNDYAKKNEDGEPVVNQDDEGRSFLVMEDSIAYNLEITKMMEEEFTIEVTDANKEMIRTVQDIVLNIDKEFSGFEAEKYNRFCDVLESVVIK